MTDPDLSRLRALHATGLLDSPPEETFDRVTRLVRRILGVPVALVSLVDRDRQFFKSQQGLPEPWATLRETPLSHSFCQHVVASGEPLVVEDAARDALVRDNLAREDLGVVGYLGVPLATEDGHVLGSLCAITGAPRRWSEEDLATLRDLAAIVITEVKLRREVAVRQAAESELKLLAEELHHRVKNSIATAQAVALLSIRTASSLDDLARTVGERLVALAATHDLLAGATRPTLALRTLLARELGAFDPTGRVRCRGPEVKLQPDAGVAFGMILHELATNAAKYGALGHETGRVDVSWEIGETTFALVWAESGAGGLAAQPTRRGFGSHLIDRLARHQLGGRAVVEYRPGGVHVLVECDPDRVCDPDEPAPKG